MLKLNQERMRHAIVAMWCIAVACILMLFFEIYSISIFQKINSNGITFEDIEMLQNFGFLAIGVASIYLIIFIVTAVFFIQWFRRAYFNLHVLVKSSNLRYSEGWAAGAWFVPIFNLFGPFQIATDLVNNSEALLMKNGMLEKSDDSLKLIKGWWWGLWIGGSVLSQVSSRVEGEFSMVALGVSIVSSLMFIVAGILAIRFIRGYGEYERMLQTLKPDSALSHMDNSDLLDTGI